MMGRPAVKVMRHLLPRPFGFGGERNLALVVQRARPITTIATVTRGIATADVTSYWGYVYPFYMAEGDDENHLLAGAIDRTENLNRRLVRQVEAVVGRALNVEDVGWYVFGVLSAPSFRRRFAAALQEDHPRIPFPADPTLFEEMRAIGAELALAHLGEVGIAGDIRFEGEGNDTVEEVRYDAEAESVWVNRTQRFTGVPPNAWAWGGSFRPLEHFLTDRRGRRLDADQIGAFQSAIQAVRASIRLEPGLDATMERIAAEPLGMGTGD
jgi:Type ISP C-terminal specificity domain